ncbi:response regulator [Propionicimonas sp.]|uniref:response regulator n=1 Tax=Propionicimonas sp. TaxID=1955623 RepID=UPI0039E5A9E4
MGSQSPRPDTRDPAVRVAIIDDDLFVRTALAALLGRGDGVEVVGAYPTGLDALDALRDEPPGVFLIDIAMPEPDGVQTTRMIRDAIPSAKVMALTSVSTQQAASDMISAGAAGFIMKDTPVAAMLDSIRAVGAGLSVLSAPATELIATMSDQPDATTLTDGERAVLRLVAQGFTNAEIAPKVFLTTSTVKYHVAALMTKLSARNRVMLAVRAHEMGIR